MGNEQSTSTGNNIFGTGAGGGGGGGRGGAGGCASGGGNINILTKINSENHSTNIQADQPRAPPPPDYLG